MRARTAAREASARRALRMLDKHVSMETFAVAMKVVRFCCVLCVDLCDVCEPIFSETHRDLLQADAESVLGAAGVEFKRRFSLVDGKLTPAVGVVPTPALAYDLGFVGDLVGFFS